MNHLEFALRSCYWQNDLLAVCLGMWLSLWIIERGSRLEEREQKRRKTFEVYDVELLREAACTQQLRRSAYRL